MGKVDKKTRRGKIANKTFGARRKTKHNKRKEQLAKASE